MKFNVGNLVTHVPTKSIWIIVDARPYDNSHNRTAPWEAEVEAFCVYSGPEPRSDPYWKPGSLDTWLLTKQDVDPLDAIWQVETVV